MTSARTWVVLDISRGSELATRSEAIRHHTLEHNRLEVSAGKVDGCGVSSRARSDDDHFGVLGCSRAHGR